jgi:hypothetical protein
MTRILLALLAVVALACVGITPTEPPDDRSLVADSTGSIRIIFCVDTCQTNDTTSTADSTAQKPRR